MIEWYYITIAAAVSMGIATIIEKYALKNVHASAYTAAFSIIAALFSLSILPFANLNIGVATWIAIYILSILVTASYLLLAKAFRHGRISVGTAITSSMPSLFTVVLGFVFIGESLKLYEYAAIAVLVVASYVFLARYNNDQSDAKGKGMRYADILIGTSLLNAIAYVAVKYLIDVGLDPLTYVVLSQLFVALNMCIYMIARFGGVKEIASNVRQNAVPLVAIGVFTVGYRVPLYLSISATEVSLAVPLLNAVFIIVTVLVGGAIFREGNLFKKTILGLVLVAASYLLIV
ncbi:MAG: EamA family transporter [Candidatus Micrarchaeota archaeon]|nr:EamA family transporter [Candidatus Micrarchaeota archaeon]